MFSSYNDLPAQFEEVLHSALMDYNESGVAGYQQIAITSQNCRNVAECIMDVFEERSILNQLNSFPVYRDWFPYDFDWVEAIEEGFERGNQFWIIEECPGIIEDFVLPAMYEEEFLIED